MTKVQGATQTTNFSKTLTFDNLTVIISGSIAIGTTAKTITGTITIKATNDTTGQTIFQKTFPINLNFASMGTTNLYS